MANVSIMTNIDFFKAVAANEITDEVIAKANELVAKDEADKAKAKAKRAEKTKVADGNADVLFGFLTHEPQTASQLADLLIGAGVERDNGKSITRQYVSVLMRTLIDDCRAERTVIKKGGEKNKRTGYVLA